MGANWRELENSSREVRLILTGAVVFVESMRTVYAHLKGSQKCPDT
jgi:hypothetical protein